MQNKETRPVASSESLRKKIARVLVFRRIEAGVVGERSLFTAIVVDALSERLHKLVAALTGGRPR